MAFAIVVCMNTNTASFAAVLATFAPKDIADLDGDGWAFRPVTTADKCHCGAPAVGEMREPGFELSTYCAPHLTDTIRANVEALDMGCF